MTSPYTGLPSEAYWRSAVTEEDFSRPRSLYRKKFSIQGKRIACAGSCFAQHIGRSLKSNGFLVIDSEPPPQGLAPRSHARFGYSMYSARYGNIYSIRQMLQLVQEAYGEWRPGEFSWAGPNGRHFDALRPSIEPEGLSSSEEVMAHRQLHLRKVRDVLNSMDILVFTFGLTEAWVHRETGTVFPTAPETIAGRFDPSIYAFKNFTCEEVATDFTTMMKVLDRHRQTRPLQYILTVSPVPLTATAAGQHAMVSTVYSKSVLRAAAGELAAACDTVDYFPSYEMISNPWSGQNYYEANRRSVNAQGVAAVMQAFFAEHTPGGASAQPSAEPRQAPSSPFPRPQDDVVCEEELLEAFSSTA